MKPVQVMAFAPLHSPEVTKISPDLATLQAIVGGLVEIFQVELAGATYKVAIHEDAEAMRKPRNRAIDGRTLYGTFILLKTDHGRYVDIKAKEAMTIWQMIDQERA